MASLCRSGRDAVVSLTTSRAALWMLPMHTDPTPACHHPDPGDILIPMSELSGNNSEVSPVGSHVTELIRAASQGEPSAAGQLFPLIYNELRALAQRQLAHERPNHTLQPTALVHEVYLKLIRNEEIDWKGKGHFYVAAVEAMRRILVDHARQHGAIKRGRDWRNVSLKLSDLVSGRGLDELLEVNDELECLKAQDPVAAQIVHLRFFVGLSIEDTAKALGTSPRSVDRQWQYAKAWLKKRLTDKDAGSNPAKETESK